MVEEDYIATPEQFLKFLDETLFRYNQGIYKHSNEKFAFCSLCVLPIYPLSDSIEMPEVIKKEGIISSFVNYFHKSCLDLYKKEKKSLDECLLCKDHSFEIGLLIFRTNFKLFRFNKLIKEIESGSKPH